MTGLDVQTNVGNFSASKCATPIMSLYLLMTASDCKVHGFPLRFEALDLRVGDVLLFIGGIVVILVFAGNIYFRVRQIVLYDSWNYLHQST